MESGHYGSLTQWLVLLDMMQKHERVDEGHGLCNFNKVKDSLRHAIGI